MGEVEVLGGESGGAGDWSRRGGKGQERNNAIVIEAIPLGR